MLKYILLLIGFVLLIMTIYYGRKWHFIKSFKIYTGKSEQQALMSIRKRSSYTEDTTSTTMTTRGTTSSISTPISDLKSENVDIVDDESYILAQKKKAQELQYTEQKPASYVVRKDDNATGVLDDNETQDTDHHTLERDSTTMSQDLLTNAFNQHSKSIDKKIKGSSNSMIQDTLNMVRKTSKPKRINKIVEVNKLDSNPVEDDSVTDTPTLRPVMKDDVAPRGTTKTTRKLSRKNTSDLITDKFVDLSKSHTEDNLSTPKPNSATAVKTKPPVKTPVVPKSENTSTQKVVQPKQKQKPVDKKNEKLVKKEVPIAYDTDKQLATPEKASDATQYAAYGTMTGVLLDDSELPVVSTEQDEVMPEENNIVINKMSVKVINRLGAYKKMKGSKTI